MSPRADVFPNLGSALNARYRGHEDRDWQEWHANHFYKDASLVPDDAERALLGRETKFTYRGLAAKQQIRHLIVGNADQACIEEIGQLQKLKRLELEYPVVADDLGPILKLTSLKFLSLDSPRKLADFSPLLRLPALRTLIITNAKKMTDLEWLGSANHLEVIGVEGGTWSTFTIPSLLPLAGLSSLRALLATSTRLVDKSLTPLADCPNLKFIGMARAAPRAEFERLRQARPDIYCDWFRPEMWIKRR